jgi:phosphatidylglycerophosphate synthase
MDRAQTIGIDARPHGPDGPLAAHVVLGRPVLAHLLEAAGTTGAAGPVEVFVRPGDEEGLSEIAACRGPCPAAVRTGDPHPSRPLLRADRLYGLSALRRGLEPDRAVLWRLDTPAGLAGAEAELLRRTSYQPLGRYWALGPARWLARRLAPTRVRPNAVTLAAFALMMAGAALIARDAAAPLAAAALAAGLVLDTADGHLARLQGTASDFGRWLDGLLDELADQALHVAAAWACFARDGWVGWLLIAAAYLAGKHLFVQASADWDRIRAAAAPASTSGSAASGRPARLVRHLAHADVRWHLWIALAAIGRMEIALVAYAAYYPARTAAGVVGKWRACRRGTT